MWNFVVGAVKIMVERQGNILMNAADQALQLKILMLFVRIYSIRITVVGGLHGGKPENCFVSFCL